MKNNLIGVIIAVVCAVTIAGMVLVPFADSVTSTTKTYYNEGTPFVLADAADTDTHTLVLGSDDDGNMEITLDGEICEIPDFSLYSAASVLYGDRTFVRLASSGAVNMYGNNGSASYGGVSLGNCLSSDITFTIVGNVATVSTYTISNLFAYISNEGTYRLCANPYVLEDSVVYAGVYSIFSNAGIGVVVYGGLDDLTGYACYPSGRSVDEPVVNLTDSVTNLKVLDSITMGCYSGVNLLGTMMVIYLLAPYEIVYDNPDYIGSTESALIGTTPLLCVVLIVMAFIYAVFRGRDY